MSGLERLVRSARSAVKLTRFERTNVFIGMALVGLEQAVVVGMAAEPSLSNPTWIRGYALGYAAAGFAISLIRPGAYLLAGAGIFVAALLMAVLFPGAWGNTFWPGPPFLLGGAAMSGEIAGWFVGGAGRRVFKRPRLS